MPSRHSRKIYVENGYYHTFNRGVEKRTIFLDTQDYKVFLKYLKEYLSPPPDKSKLPKVNFTLQGQAFKGLPRIPKNYHAEINLICWCLMPNHFHLLIQQNNKLSMKQFVHSLLTRYTKYFNKKYDRVGPLFQGRYKAVMIMDDGYLLHLSRYIHLNPSEYTKDLTKAYSSYADYLGLRKTEWVKPDIILKFFNQKSLLELKELQTYKDFVEKYKKNSAKVLGKLTLEN